MTSTAPPTREDDLVAPPEDFAAMFELARFLESHSEPAALLGPDGQQIPLPIEAYDILRSVVKAMERGASIHVEPVDRQLTTQQAANLLGISRSTLVRLLDDHELPYEQLGDSRHRRLRQGDVLAYRERKRRERRALLRDMTRQATDGGLYDVDSDAYQDALQEARKS